MQIRTEVYTTPIYCFLTQITDLHFTPDFTPIIVQQKVIIDLLPQICFEACRVLLEKNMAPDQLCKHFRGHRSRLRFWLMSFLLKVVLKIASTALQHREQEIWALTITSPDSLSLNYLLLSSFDPFVWYSHHLEANQLNAVHRSQWLHPAVSTEEDLHKISEIWTNEQRSNNRISDSGRSFRAQAETRL